MTVGLWVATGSDIPRRACFSHADTLGIDALPGQYGRRDWHIVAASDRMVRRMGGRSAARRDILSHGAGIGATPEAYA